ncbi:LPP20 family lipoprotein [Sulfurimonas sp.]|jgi:hypothetical protein|uniref:LPP20 family lipoprotein n=1 Tax=Sulfurimonas sp. TaxID=2022749 RepID=UPI0025DC0E16|nr:LPP20 family lipoprotein [Sulfurimonas sp.]MBT5934567.1 LPP20 family lipoprotein [Sulfurimonas sp.]
MKKILLVIFTPLIMFANPLWLYQIKHDKNCDIIGYGISKNLQEAKKNALADIANTLSVSVDTSFDMSTIDNNVNVKTNSSLSLKTNSKAVLSGVEFIKIEQKNSIWYVAAKYDNSPLDVKLKKLLPSNLQNETQNNYLKNTSLLKELNKELKAKLNYKVIRKNNLWQLKYKDILLPINIENFYKLFSNQNTNLISIKPNKNIYIENDDMFFNIAHKKNGFISILYVEHSGKVGLLLANKKSDKSFLFPNIKNEDSFKIVNPYNKSIKELYVALYSPTPIKLHKFENVDENLLDESNYNFDELISLLNEFKFSTYEIKIRK